MTTEHDAPDSENLQDELTERGREVWLAGLGALGGSVACRYLRRAVTC